MNSSTITRYPILIDGHTAEIGSAGELAIALDVLQGQYDREALSQLRPHLAGVIRHADGFVTVMRALSVDDQVYLADALGGELAGVLKSARALRDLLAMTAERRVEEALLRALGGDGLRRLLTSAKELAEVLEWLYGECDELALELVGLEGVRGLCRSALDLSDVLHNLSPELQARLLAGLGPEFVQGLVRSGRDLAYLLRALPPAESQRLLHHFDGRQLVQLIGSSSEWAYLYQRMEPAEAEYVVAALSNR